jgi:hypothetical protein
LLDSKHTGPIVTPLGLRVLIKQEHTGAAADHGRTTFETQDLLDGKTEERQEIQGLFS